MPNDNDFMQHAINLAKHAASQNEVPIGAIIVLNDQIIAEGWNQPIASNDPTAHAEIIVLRSAAQQLNNYRLLNTTLYVTLEPCLMCVGSMIHARIKQLVFGAYDPKSGAVKFLDSKKLNHSITYQGGVMEQKCGELLTTFFQKRRI